ncbi:response regulator transcription factor [Propionivibrio sp.]|uniref:response regulator n=1 Tax=Propionivibrio sp. TaxID=2212460 RepID=UPI0039E235FF
MTSAATNPPLKVVLIEDSHLLQEALGALLGDLERVEVVGGAADEPGALELLQRLRPDLAIVDLQLRAGSGLGVLRALSSEPDRFGRPRTVVFSHHDHLAVRELCFMLGVERFFDKATQTNDLLAYVRQATH